MKNGNYLPKQLRSFFDNYKTLLVAAVLILLNFSSYAQYDSTKQLQPVSAYGNANKNGSFSGSLVIPKDTFHLAVRDSGAMAFKNGLWFWTGHYWESINTSGVIDTTCQFITSIMRIPGVDSFYFNKCGVWYGIYDSTGTGGGSSSNTSIGSGYKIAVNVNAANIKSLTGSTGILLDSATTGQIGFKVDSLQFATRARLMHVTDSLLTIIGAKPSGSGTTDYLARWTASNTLGVGATRDDGTNVGIGVAPGTYKLNVNGSINAATSIYLPSSSGTTGNIYKNGTKWLHNGGLSGSSLTNIYLGNAAGNDTALFYNIGIGGFALQKNNGYGNIAIGDGALANMAGYDGGDNSSNNIFMGARAGYNATGGHRNISIGVESGDHFNDSSYSNIAIGKGTGRGQRGGVGNVYLGASIASIDYAWGGWNTIVGSDIMQNLTSGAANALLGANILVNGTTASGNSIVGEHAMGQGNANQNNAVLGYYAGSAVTGNGNVLLGAFAGAYETAISNKLIIDAGAGAARHLINGDFSTRKVGIDRTLSELAAASQAFQVNGSIYATTNIKLGGVTLGNGHKNLRFNTTDSLPYLVDTTTFSAGFGLMLTGTHPNIHYILDSSEAATLTALRDTAAAIRAAGGGSMVYPGAGIAISNGSAWITSLSVDSITTKWGTLGNTLTGTGKFGTLSNHGYNFVTNDVVRAAMSAAGEFSTTQDASINSILIGQGPTSGLSHIRIGSSTTLASVTAGSLLNTAIGIDALRRTTTGDYNVALGYKALEKDTLGNDGIGIGRQAGENNNADKLVALGGAAAVNCVSCANSIYIENSNGSGNGVATGDWNVVIGNSIGGLSPSLHNSVVISDSAGVWLLKDSSGKTTITGGDFRYAANYAANYSTRSFVDKNYVDSSITAGGAGGGTVNSGNQYRLAYYATAGTAVSEAAAITASRALVSDANGVPTHATTTATEIGYVNGVTSAIQTQLNGKQSTITFGTGVLTALGVNIGSAGAPVLFNGAGGTPSSLTGTNITGVPLTTGLTGGNWKTIYTNGSGVVTELAIGTSGQVLTSNGTTSAPSWETPSGGGSGLNFAQVSALMVIKY